MSAPTPAVRTVAAGQSLAQSHSQAPAKAQLMQEHLLWLRHCAQAQQRVSASVAQMAAHIEALEAKVLRLRAQAVCSRSAVLWGIGGVRLPDATPPQSAPALRLAAPVAEPAEPVSAPVAARRVAAVQWPLADEVLCQTGCVGHAHHWLEDDGHCQRKGRECERLHEEGKVYVSGA